MVARYSKKGKKIGGRTTGSWKPGRSANPGGVPKDPIKIALREFTPESIKALFSEILKKDADEILALRQDQTQPVIVQMLASIATHAVYDGDMQRLDRLLDRIIGKVPDAFTGGTPMAPVFNFVPATVDTSTSNGAGKKKK